MGVDVVPHACGIIRRLTDIKAALRKAYDDRAEAYDYGNRSYTDQNLADVIGQLMSEVKRRGGRRVLDLGCGPGQDAMRMQRHGLEVLGIDLSEGMVRRARKKGVEARIGDYQALDLPPNSFDGVWAARSLQHLPKKDLPPVLATIAALLAPGGRLYMVVYEGEGEGSLASDLDYYTVQRYFAFYRQPEVRALLVQAGFRVYREWRRRLRRPRHKDVLLAFAAAKPGR
ncbi:MAG TPA: class I SAM-dependent methyltransferase [Chloroflexota bacterium]